jgi:hypothetical protein
MNNTPLDRAIETNDCIACKNLIPGDEPGTFGCSKDALRFAPDCPLFEKYQGSAS